MSDGTCDVDAISRLHFVHQVIVGVHHSGVRGLTGGHVLWRLLQLDLTIKERKHLTPKYLTHSMYTN